MPVAKIGDIQMNYTVQGSGDWVVMIGGYISGNWSSWGAQLDRMAKHFKVLAFDNRGVGETDAPDMPYTTDMMAADTLGLMKHLGITSAHIFGKSLGGAIGQCMALAEPGMVRSLAMTSTFGKTSERTKDMVRWWLGSAKSMGIADPFLSGKMTYFLTEEYNEANQASIRASVQNMMKVNRPVHGYVNTGNCLLTHDVMSRLGEIRCPTHIMIGSKDIVTTAEHSAELARLIPNAELVVVDNMLHGFMTEKPETFDLIPEFFKRH